MKRDKVTDTVFDKDSLLTQQQITNILTQRLMIIMRNIGK